MKLYMPTDEQIKAWSGLQVPHPTNPWFVFTKNNRKYVVPLERLGLALSGSPEGDIWAVDESWTPEEDGIYFVRDLTKLEILVLGL